MKKRHHVKVSMFIITLMLITQILNPAIAFAETIEVEDESNFQLFQITKEIALNESITLQEKTFIYGKKVEEQIEIQYADTYTTIPLTNVQEVQSNDRSPEFVDSEQLITRGTIKILANDSALFSLYPDETKRILINEATEYPVLKNEKGIEVVHLGNVEFYRSQEDRLVVKNALTESETTDRTKLVEESSGSNNNLEEDTQIVNTEKSKSDVLVEDNTQQLQEPLKDENKVVDEDIQTVTENQEDKGKVLDGEEEQPSKDNTENNIQNKQFSTFSINNNNTLLKTPTVQKSWKGVSHFKVTNENHVVYTKGKTKKLGELQKGQVYPIDSDYGNWHQIQYGSGYGYVLKEGTIPDEGKVLRNQNKSYTHTNQSFVTTKNIPVYDNSSGKLVAFGTIYKGEQYPIATDYGNWWRIVYADRVGYVQKSQVKKDFTGGEKYFRVLTNNLPIYDNRSGGLKKVGTLNKGQVYPIVSDYGNWHRIQFNNHYGYVLKADTEPASGSEVKNENISYKNSNRTFTTIEEVKVYDNSSGGLKAFGTIPQGRSYYIASDYGNWWRVLLSDRVGYVNKSDVKSNFISQDKYFKVLNNNLPIYDNRSGNLVKVGELTKGQVYSRISDYGPNWHKIQYGKINGYVESKYTEQASGSTVKNLNKQYDNKNRMVTALSDVPIYDNSTKGKLIKFGEIKKGKIYPIASDYGSWWRVLLSDRVGYINKDDVKANFLSGDKYFRVTTQNLPVYDNRGEGLTKVGELRKGQTYPIYSDYGNWWRVKFGEIYGYVEKKDTEYGTKSSINNLNTDYSHSKDTRIVVTKDTQVVTEGSLIPFGELTEGTIYPIATDYGKWWRIVYLDRVGYVHKNDVKIYGISKSNYNITLNEALAIQLKASPQTDKEYNTYVSSEYIKNNKVTASALNVRGGPGTNYWDVGTIYEGQTVNIIREVNGWYQIEYTNNRTWVNPSSNDLLYYLNPYNFINDERQKFQFLDLSRSSGASATVLNNYLSGKGTLNGQGQSFKDASRIHGVNDVYLVSHAILETGHGDSTLAQGVVYKGRTVYNMYGVGAYDSCPIVCGAEKAYNEGWFSPREAIIGGAKFIGNGYIKEGQNTLYKMRWNPAAMSTTGRYGKQYATDIGWASKQIYTMYNLYQQLESYTLYLDIPVYKK